MLSNAIPDDKVKFLVRKMRMKLFFTCTRIGFLSAGTEFELSRAFRGSIMNLGFSSRPRSAFYQQQLVVDVDSNPGISQKQQQISKREETVKEKIILVQEKNIRKLNELVQHLQEQLRQCRSNNGTLNGTVSPLAERILELERQQILED
ncbi:hypothetical protein L6164_022150 [Bauhinia variegata]|uniref:Uncharacterized protein n=1 Tax=Bauhinia variegata TaxID=167791 RepID=A0ACB9MFS2_BAUVA|nr:hypothetical protein L6164_022150 [Bauhinia variegata]